MQYDTSTDYAIIGGIAVAVWGEPRLTRDIDVKVLLSRDEAQMLLKVLPNPKQSGHLMGDTQYISLSRCTDAHIPAGYDPQTHGIRWNLTSYALSGSFMHKLCG
ncbi:MAG: hypothetical protein JRJ29_21895 [Deltaproteobacteria bacterium]|nr:hypothetical protein [Deltaproteobacteria bacterium]